jgi:hypothetical protein
VVQGDNTLKASLNDLLAPNYALLGDFQNTMAEAVGYSAAARRFVGITVPLLGAPSDGGNANGWHLPAQPRAMIYDIIFLSMTAPGSAGRVDRRERRLPPRPDHCPACTGRRASGSDAEGLCSPVAPSASSA